MYKNKTQITLNKIFNLLEKMTEIDFYEIFQTFLECKIDNIKIKYIHKMYFSLNRIL